jgi:hypothetical protein
MRYLPLAEQDNIRLHVAENIDYWYKHSLHNNNETPPPKMRKELFHISRKHFKNNVTMITKADKGNSIIILKITNCDNKITDFINSRDFTLLNADSTQAYHKKKVKVINFIKH